MDLGPDISNTVFVLGIFHTSEQRYGSRNSEDLCILLFPAKEYQERQVCIKRNIFHHYLILQPSLSNAEKQSNHITHFKPKKLTAYRVFAER